MGRFVRFITTLILICIIIAIGYAYFNFDEVIEYRDNKLIEYKKEKIDENVIINEIIIENNVN